MSRLIYAVFGQTGEYSDQVAWPVAAYLDEEKAKARVLKCTEQAKELATEGWRIRDYNGKREALDWPEYAENSKPYRADHIPPATTSDPDIQISDVESTTYYYETMIIEDWVDGP